MDYRDAAHNFAVLYRRSQSFIVASCSAWNISFSEYVLLLKLYEKAGVNQEELSVSLSTDKGLVARTIKVLEDKKYVRREQDIKDKRLKHIYPTPKALAIKEQLQVILQEWVRQITAGMTPTVVENTITGIRVAAENAAAIDTKFGKGSVSK